MTDSKHGEGTSSSKGAPTTDAPQKGDGSTSGAEKGTSNDTSAESRGDGRDSGSSSSSDR